ncbi:MAG: SUMF1/EgtB/PvdO family nonheme iron enzyme [Pedobacter sp.]
MKPANRVSQFYVPMAFILLFVNLLLSGVARGSAVAPDIRTAFVKGGCYGMGDQSGVGGYDEKPAHEVCVDDFRIGIFEVTEAQWNEVLGDKLPLRLMRGANYPACGVNWHDVHEFIKRLNTLSGLKYRLPTEAEWEYAARSGGKQQMYSGTNDENTLADYACGKLSCAGTPLSAGSKKANALGIYDMSGNVMEWVLDRYDPYYYRQSPRMNPQGDPFGINRVLRGGASDSVNGQLRTSYREYLLPATRKDGIGFRLLLQTK